MIEIKSKITVGIDWLKTITVEELDSEPYNFEGCIFFDFNGNTYGHYYDGDLESDELLSIWFSSLVDVIKALEKGNYAAFSMIDALDQWMEFSRSEDEVLVSLGELGDRYFRKIDRNSYVRDIFITTPKIKFTYGDWKDVSISYSEFKMKVIECIQNHIKEVERINPNLIESKIIKQLRNELFNIIT